MDIDRELAEKVMVWKHFISITDFVKPSYCETKDDIHFTFIVYEHGWHPSTDIKQAFDVVAKMREKSLWLSLVQQAEKNPVWRARFSFGGMAVGDRTRGVAEADTPAMAICLAALKAVESS